MNLAKRIRQEVGVTGYRFSTEAACDYYGIMWVYAELPATIYAVCQPDEKIVLIRRGLSHRARRFYLCHEIVEIIQPSTIVHGSFYNEVAAHVLAPLEYVSVASKSAGSNIEVAKLFDVPVGVVEWQMRMNGALYG